MWLMMKEWFNKNKAYLTTLFLSSLAIGVTVATLSAVFPGVLTAFTGIILFGAAPLAFLTALSLPLAALTLGLIVTAASSILIAASLVSMQQLATIGTHISSLFTFKEEPNVLPTSEVSYDFLSKYLKLHTLVHHVDVDENEFHELSSDISEVDEEQFLPPAPREFNIPVETESASSSMSLS